MPPPLPRCDPASLEIPPPCKEAVARATHDVNPTSGPFTQFRGSFLAPNKNHTLFTRLTMVQSPSITYDAMVSARVLDGQGNFGARVIVGQSGSPAPILIKHDMKTPRSRQMSLGIGHQFTSELGMNVDYVRQHMDNLYVQRNPNYLDRTVTSQPVPAHRELRRHRAVGRPWPVRRLGRADAGYLAAEPHADEPGLHPIVLSEVSPIPFGIMLSSIATFASPRPYLTIDGRDINLNNIAGDDFPAAR